MAPIKKSKPFAKPTRRDLLRIGGLTTLGLGLPEFLRASAPAGPRRGSEKSCIFIMQCGGASHLDTLDPKPNAPAEIRGPYPGAGHRFAHRPRRPACLQPGAGAGGIA